MDTAADHRVCDPADVIIYNFSPTCHESIDEPIVGSVQPSTSLYFLTPLLKIYPKPEAKHSIPLLIYL